MNLKIDPEFQEKIPPLTEEEFAQLEENILEDGEVHTPIVVWDGKIVDGHNRWKILQKHPEIPYKIKEMEFADKWEAFDWMYKNQLGRRNLTDEQRDYLRGKLYEARKHTVGEHRGNQYTKMELAQNGQIPNSVAEQIAKEQGVGTNTIRRAEQFAKGIDAIREEDPELADDILTSKKKVTKTDIQYVGSSPKNERQHLIDSIKSNQKLITRNRLESRKNKDDGTEVISQIKDDIRDSRTITTYQPTLDDLLRDIRNNSSPYIRLLNSLISGYSTVIRGNSKTVISVIDECIVKEIEKMKENIINEYA